MQELLPTFECSENDLIERALHVPLDRKIEKAVLLLQEYEKEALKLYDGGYWVCDSYGKDSGVIVHLAKLAGVRHECHHNVTGIDPPELMWFGAKHRPETVRHRPKKHMVLTRMVEKHFPPTRLTRWCCAEYKEHGGDGKAKVIGVRIAESARRKGLWKTVNRRRNDELIIAPIAYWTDSDVWEFHRIYNLPYCCLYDEGFTRLGCIGCPLAGPAGQRREFVRWPRYEALWRRGFKKMWDKYHGIPNRKGQPMFFEKFGSANATFEWWVSGGAWEGNNPQCVFEEMMENI
jgi:phosphoadenosine phosphosulfate reductase